MGGSRGETGEGVWVYTRVAVRASGEILDIFF